MQTILFSDKLMNASLSSHGTVNFPINTQLMASNELFHPPQISTAIKNRKAAGTKFEASVLANSSYFKNRSKSVFTRDKHYGSQTQLGDHDQLDNTHEMYSRIL